MFICFIVLGGLSGLGYDCLRAFRREVSHNVLWITIEDIVYGAAAMAACYALFFWQNQGALRIYGFIGQIGGAALYFLTVSPLIIYFWRTIWKLILLPMRFVKKIYERTKAARRQKAQKSIDE